MARAFAPGRVNLIGEHTDTTGGLVMPMAIQLGTTIEFDPIDARIELTSDAADGRLALDLPVSDPRAVEPSWGRYVAGVATRLDARRGFRGHVTSSLPLGSGLSSSASLEVAVALALGAPGSATEIALVCRDAEELASGVPCGVMDQLASVAGVAGHALVIDCHTLAIAPVPIPTTAAITVIHSGQHRSLAGSDYGLRRAEVDAAETIIGPLRLATPDAVDEIGDDTIRRRARHVVTENRRVTAFASALASGDLVAAGALMRASHHSLRDDFGVSTDALDALVDELGGVDGVHGVRLTGAGFGGCVVALHDPALDLRGFGAGSWRVEPSAGAALAAPD